MSGTTAAFRTIGTPIPLALVLTLAWPSGEVAAQGPRPVVVGAITVDGRPVTTAAGIRVTPPGETRGTARTLREQDELLPGSILEMPLRTAVTLVTLNGTELTLQPGSRTRLNAVSPRGESFTQLFGEAWFTVVKTLDFFEVVHERFLAAVKGTEFRVSVDDQDVQFGWISGQFEVSRDVGITINGAAQRDTVLVTEEVSAEQQAVNHRRGVDEYLDDFDSSDDVERYFRDQLVEDELSGDSVVIAEGLTNLGTALVTVGRPAEAIPYHQRSLALHLALHPDGVHPAIARDYGKLGAAYAQLDDAPRSVEWYERSRNLLLEIYPDGVHPEIAVTDTNLGVEYGKLSEPRRAIAYFEDSLALLPRLYPVPEGSDPNPTAATAMAANFGNLGVEYGRLKEPRTAIDYFERALALHQQLHSDGLHPDIAADYVNLGVQHLALQEWPQAVEAYDRAVAVLLRLYPDGVHPYLVVAYRNLASVWRALGDAGRADEYTRREQDVATRLRQ